MLSINRYLIFYNITMPKTNWLFFHFLCLWIPYGIHFQLIRMILPNTIENDSHVQINKMAIEEIKQKNILIEKIYTGTKLSELYYFFAPFLQLVFDWEKIWIYLNEVFWIIFLFAPFPRLVARRANKIIRSESCRWNIM